MTISFACPSCRKGYTVNASLAGRAGKCKACGRAMSVPSVLADEEEDHVASEGYGLAQAIAVEPDVGAVNVFSPGRNDPEFERAPRPRSTSTMKRRTSRVEVDPFHVRHRQLLIVSPLVVLALLGIVAIAVPGGRLIVASILAGIGGLLVLVGYVVGLWAAWREDSLYGFLYFFIPLYSAYYILTRWDDMWPWFVAMTVGVVLVSVAGLMVDMKDGEAVQAEALRARKIIALSPVECGPSLNRALGV
jgi:hypothetical protein